MNASIREFVQALQGMPKLSGVFVPWRDLDSEHDIGEESPRTRAAHLEQYLEERLGRARVVLCAEALGYQGGHFSGIAMTSERILLGNLAHQGVDAEDVIAGGGRRTSRVTAKTPALGANEPTATTVWSTLKANGIDTRDVVLWNAFAAHPMEADGAWLTNRKPSKAELRIGKPLLEQLLAMFPAAKTVAIGRVSEDLLKDMGVRVAGQVRHPAYGGVTDFRAGVLQLLA